MLMEQSNQKKIEVEMDFLMKLTNQIDNLTEKFKQFENTQEKSIKDPYISRPISVSTPSINYTITLSAPEGQQQEKIKAFLEKFMNMLKEYQVSIFDVKYKQQ